MGEAGGLGLIRGDPVRDRGRLDAGGDVELLEDVRDVDAGGLDADHECAGDLAVRIAAGDERQDLGLARRQPYRSSHA